MSRFLQDGGKQCDGQTTVVVHFLDNSSKTVLADEQTTVEEILEEVFGRLLISDARINSTHFGLYESVDGNIVGDRLLSREKILNVQDSCAKIIMQYRLLVHRVPLSPCKMVRHLLYVQCLHRIITGYYYCSKEDAIRLAALCILERYGVPSGNLGSDKITNYLSELVPRYLLNEYSPSQLASEIVDIYSKFKKDPDDPHAMDDVKGLYLSMFENLGSTRGQFLCTLFKCKQTTFRSISKNIILAINADDVRILDGSSYEKKKEFDLNNIYQWGFDENTLNFYIRMSEQSQQILFETERGIEISTLLTDIAVARLKDIEEGGYSEEEDSYSEEEKDQDYDLARYYGKVEKIVRLQAQWRSSLHRKRMNKEYAAVMLQCAFRGHKARVQFDQYIDMIAAGNEEAVTKQLAQNRLK